LGWGEQNLVNIAQMRVMKANGQMIEYPSTNNVHVPLVLPFAPNKKTFSQTKRSLINTAKLLSISLPILTDGKRTSLYQALDSLLHLDIVS
jgi:predicted metalloenzyme YecM